MARAESIKMIERHVEKLVLAVCLLALVLASWHWLFSSPTELEIFIASAGRTVMVSPTEADAKLRVSATAVGEMYSGSDLAKSIAPVPAWVGRLNDQRAIYGLPASPTDLAEPRRPIGPIEPTTGPADTGRKELIAAMPAPAKPVVISSLELPNRLPPTDVVLARGLSSYPLEALGTAW